MHPRAFAPIIMIVAGCDDPAGTSRDVTQASDAVTTASDSMAGDTSVDVAADTSADATTITSADTSSDTGAPVVTYWLHGEAEGADEALDVRAECSFDALIDGVVENETGFEGMAHGEVFRYVLPDTRRFEFQALIAGPVSLTRTFPSEAELRAFGDQPDDAKAFWVALEVLYAVEGDRGGWFGDFECRPIEADFGPYTDDQITVPGTWSLERLTTP